MPLDAMDDLARDPVVVVARRGAGHRRHHPPVRIVHQLEEIIRSARPLIVAIEPVLRCARHRPRAARHRPVRRPARAAGVDDRRDPLEARRAGAHLPRVQRHHRIEPLAQPFPGTSAPRSYPPPPTTPWWRWTRPPAPSCARAASPRSATHLPRLAAVEEHHSRRGAQEAAPRSPRHQRQPPPRSRAAAEAVDAPSTSPCRRSATMYSTIPAACPSPPSPSWQSQTRDQTESVEMLASASAAHASRAPVEVEGRAGNSRAIAMTLPEPGARRVAAEPSSRSTSDVQPSSTGEGPRHMATHQRRPSSLSVDWRGSGP